MWKPITAAAALGAAAADAGCGSGGGSSQAAATATHATCPAGTHNQIACAASAQQSARRFHSGRRALRYARKVRRPCDGPATGQGVAVT